LETEWIRILYRKTGAGVQFHGGINAFCDLLKQLQPAEQNSKFSFSKTGAGIKLVGVVSESKKLNSNHLCPTLGTPDGKLKPANQ